jgi:chromate transporter
MLGGTIKMNGSNPLFTVAAHFFLLSFLAFGGANSIIPELHRLFVYHYQWMSEQQFIDFFALSRVAPGPNIIIATLLGWHIAHFWGAIVATLAICVPSCMVTYGVGRLWERFNHKPWLIILKEGLFPLVLGFVMAAILILVQVADDSLFALFITLIAAILSYRFQLHPLWIVGGAVLLGCEGWV